MSTTYMEPTEDATAMERAYAETALVMTVIAMLEWLACPGASPCWCNHCLTESAARRIIADCDALDFSVEAMGHGISSRQRR